MSKPRPPRAAPKGRGPRKRPPLMREEEIAQRWIVHQLRLHGVLFCAPGNGTYIEHEKTRGDAVAMGQEKGVPDLLIFTAPPGRPDARGVAVELKKASKKPKTDRAGKFSGAEPHQKVYLKRLQEEGWIAFVGYGKVHTIERLNDLGFTLNPGDGRRWRGAPPAAAPSPPQAPSPQPIHATPPQADQSIP